MEIRTNLDRFVAGQGCLSRSIVRGVNGDPVNFHEAFQGYLHENAPTTIQPSIRCRTP
jgi:hypothetical protein